jgi:carboxyl-terminal processing protease
MKKYFLSTVALAALTACGGAGDDLISVLVPNGYPGNPVACDVAIKRAWLRSYMDDQYYWYKNQGKPDDSADSMDAYFQSLLYKPVDRYSSTQSTASATQFYQEGTRLGYGYALAWADASKTVLKVSLVEPQSPMYAAGLRRGDEIVTIDGKNAQDVANGAVSPASAEGQPRSFVVKNSAGVQRSFSVNSAVFNLSPVLLSKTLAVSTPSGDKKVGYLAYNEFIEPGNAALGAAFNQFAVDGVSELVVDLRYNGGGSVSVSRGLASMVGGAALAGKVFAAGKYNNKNSSKNFSFDFTSAGLPGATLNNLNRVIFIGAGGTASASELLINGLKPFKEVRLIGDTTYGKPYGSQPRDACGTTYNPIVAEFVNAQDIGGYSNGLAADCTVPDDLSKALGDPSEKRLAAAITYIQTGACPVNTQANQALAGVKYAGAATKLIVKDESLGEQAPKQMTLN